jgi:L-fuconolactonase
MAVDAHQHFWDLDRFQYLWITKEMVVSRRNVLPADLRPVLDRVGIDCTVFVPAQHSLAENGVPFDLLLRPQQLKSIPELAPRIRG